jgi:hypothetical protein
MPHELQGGCIGSCLRGVGQDCRQVGHNRPPCRGGFPPSNPYAAGLASVAW